MDSCIVESGSYCEGGNHKAICDSWVSICDMYSALFELLSKNFAVGTQRDQAHAVLAGLLGQAGFTDRFPEGIYVNLSAAPYDEQVTSILQSLDLPTRSDEKRMKEGEIPAEDSWEYDDASTSYYKGLRELNRLLYSGAEVYDRKRFEAENNLIFA